MAGLNPSAIPSATTTTTTNTNTNQDYPTYSTNNTSHDKPQPYSDQKHLRTSRKANGQKTTKRDTHFISFPLVTDHSIPQLAASLAQFRRVTTITPEVVTSRRQRQRQQQHQQEGVNDDKGNEDDDDGGGRGRGRGRGELEEEEQLKILPAVVHRPPGTFHLTLGTMDLSEKSEMERAVRVLKGLDLRAMLGHVEREVGFHRVAKAEEDDDVGGDEKSSGKSNELRSLTRPISPPPLPPPPPPAAAASSSSSSSSSSPSSRPPSPITISLSGLSTFPGPQHARVFYAPPIDPSNRLLSLANKIRAVFKAEGFVTETRELTLHATIANMRYANNSNHKNNHNNHSSGNSDTQGRGGGKERRGGGGRGGGRRSRVGEVDGRRIVEWFGGADGTGQGLNAREGEEGQGGGKASFVWAEGIVVDRVRICKMGAEKSQDHVLGMVYPPIRIGEKEEEEEAQVWF